MNEGTCKHFNGIQHKRCDANVVYMEVATPVTDEQREWSKRNFPELPQTGRTALVKRVPCFTENKLTGNCPSFCEPTQAEIDAYEKETNEFLKSFLEKMSIVRPAITVHIKENGWEKRSVQSSIPCPICKTGTVHYTYAGNYNRHIHAQCTTNDCVRWME